MQPAPTQEATDSFAPVPVQLSALFERYQVNSASAFIRLFTSTCLAPPSGGKPPLAKGGAAPRALPAAEPAAAWAVQEAGQSTYIGQLRGGRRHGRGVLVTQVRPPRRHP